MKEAPAGFTSFWEDADPLKNAKTRLIHRKTALEKEQSKLESHIVDLTGRSQEVRRVVVFFFRPINIIL